MKVPVVLVVGGLDTGNGAGVESDVKALATIGVHGVIAVSALTVQTTRGIKKVVPIDPATFRENIEAVIEDFEPSVVKTGMVWEGQYEVLKDAVNRYGLKLVVDPVLRAKDGSVLIPDIEGLRHLIRGAFAITPNVPEAEYLSGMKISDIHDQVQVASKLREVFFVENVIVKGGHLSGTDVGVFGGKVVKVSGRLYESRNTHGTGSVFASFFSGFIAKGLTPEEAFEKASRLTRLSVLYSFDVGKGVGPVNPTAVLLLSAEKYRVLEEMYVLGRAIEEMENFNRLVPEVQMNVAHSVSPELVTSLDEIAVFENRIVKNWRGEVKVGFPVVFGKPTHTARLLYASIRLGARYTFAVNLRYEEGIVELLRKYYSPRDVVEVDREREPEKDIEGKSMEWIVNYVREKHGAVPRVIYDTGVKGKEAMVRLFALNLEELLGVLKFLTSKI